MEQLIRKSSATFMISGLLGLVGGALLLWMATGPVQSDPERQAELILRLGEVGGAIFGVAIAIGIGGLLLRRKGK